jgi:predicted ATPase
VAALSGQQALLVLDNCEHLVAAVAVLADRVLSQCPQVGIMATSREPLNIPGEMLWPVQPLPRAGVSLPLAAFPVSLAAFFARPPPGWDMAAPENHT